MRYAELVEAYEALAATTKRLTKTHLLAQLLQRVPTAELARVILLVQGRVFPRWDKRTLGISSKLAAKAIAQAAGESEQQVHDRWRKLGDLGKVAGELVSTKKQATLVQQELSVKEVYEKLRKLPGIEGHGSVETKLKLIASLLSAASEKAAQYLIRTILEEMRVGIAEGTMRDAICWAYLKPPIRYDEEKQDLVMEDPTARERYNELIQAVQSAYDRSNDFATVAETAKQGGAQELRKITFSIGTPIRVMLAQRAASVHDAFERVGRPCAFEYKYDGFRMQIHKDGETVKLFTRRLEEVTAQFPELVATVTELVKPKRCILDGETVGYDRTTGKYTPFQAISQRIRRKYEIGRLAEQLPVEFCLFDIYQLEGTEVMQLPFSERRKLLHQVLPEERPKRMRLSAYLETADDQEAEHFYKEALAAGQEGLMAKKLDAPYQPGSRVNTWIKVKPTLETMDLVIVGAEWGEGKRSGWLTSFTLACYDPAEDEFLTVGKVGTGLKELDSEEQAAVTFDMLTQRLRDSIIEQRGRDVVLKPQVVLEIKCEEIQKSPTYSSGFALRFPRVVKLRDDRSPDSATDIEEIQLAYEQQRGRSS